MNNSALYTFSVFLFVGFLPSQTRKEPQTVILVSMDGMPWNLISGVFADTPNLGKVARNGVKAEYLKTVPSKTWPTHHSFFTGLYPESHGIVSNRFWDSLYQEEFIYEYDCANFDPKFCNDSEPIYG